jgi:hypothetical protein
LNILLEGLGSFSCLQELVIYVKGGRSNGREPTEQPTDGRRLPPRERGHTSLELIEIADAYAWRYLISDGWEMIDFGIREADSSLVESQE